MQAGQERVAEQANEGSLAGQESAAGMGNHHLQGTKIESFGEQDTYELGRQMGRLALPGQMYLLDGDLGVGKTVFTQGFGEGLGVEDAINSPTFTIVQEYTEGRIPFYHFDVYRIADEEEMEEIGYEEYFFGGGVCLVEWAQNIPGLLPEDAIRIFIEKDLEKGFDYRSIRIE